MYCEMDDIEKKIRILEESCLNLAQNESNILMQKINDFANEKVEEKIDNYRDFLSDKYEKEVNRIIREFNKDIFDYDKINKIKLIKFKESLISNIKNKIKNELNFFINSYDYKEYLMKNIKSTLRRLSSVDGIYKVYVVERDYYQFRDSILKEFNIELDKIDNSNLGGCIAVNYVEKISIDNTVNTNIEQNLLQIIKELKLE